jgi:hypothetical protein
LRPIFVVVAIQVVEAITIVRARPSGFQTRHPKLGLKNASHL